MKGTIIGTDYLLKDDSVKILEINTNTTILNEGADLLDYDAFFSVLTQNNITELHFIYTIGSSYLPSNTETFRFEDILKEKCVLNNIQYFQYTVPENSVTVPHIEDSSNKFILRQSYDTTALLDETYCADKFGFLDLMKDTNLTPKSYFVDDELGMDMITELSHTIDGVPNVIVKERHPNYDLKQYPEFYEFDTNEELTTLKTQIGSNKIVQEFVYDQTNIVNNRWNVIRGIDIVYGSNLDIINLGGYQQSAVVETTFCGSEFEEGTKKYNQKTKHKFTNKPNGNYYDVTYHVDSDSNIIMQDSTLRNIQNVIVGDSLKSLDFTDLNGVSPSVDDERMLEWDGTFNKTIETISVVQTELNNLKSKDVKTLFIRITLENGMSWVDSPYSTFYIEEKNSIETRFEIVNNFYIGDNIILFNSNTNTVIKSIITNLSIEYFEQKVYELDVEPYDVFLTDIENGFFGIMHNNCDCCSYSYCGNWCCYNYCWQCSGGGFQKFQ